MESSSKRSEPRNRDRLSELPDSLIFNIFEFLPMNDVVSTQILSRRWKNLWITTPYLHFDGNLYKESYHVPNSLYSCPSLKKLLFLGDVNGINGNRVQWNQLKWLKILYPKVTEDEIDLLLSRIPMLEVFELIFTQDNNSSLSFRSNSLKELYVYMTMRPENGISKDTELRIWTPNLEILDIRGGTYGKCFLMSVSPLIHANFLFTSKIGNVWETARQIIPTMRRVKGLTLSNSFIQVRFLCHIYYALTFIVYYLAL